MCQYMRMYIVHLYSCVIQHVFVCTSMFWSCFYPPNLGWLRKASSNEEPGMGPKLRKIAEGEQWETMKVCERLRTQIFPNNFLLRAFLFSSISLMNVGILKGLQLKSNDKEVLVYRSADFLSHYFKTSYIFMSCLCIYGYIHPRVLA